MRCENRRSWSRSALRPATLLPLGFLAWSMGCRDVSGPGAPDPRAATGEWATAFEWPVVAVHLHLLPTGKVLSWGRGTYGAPHLWDPATGAFTDVASATDVFCAGHSFLPNGQLLVAGGHIDDHHGLPDANLFDATTLSWQPVAPMARGRWYPTNTTLPDGDVLTIGGRDENGNDVAVPEVWDGSTWRALPGASRVLPYYPRTFVAPNGRVFYAGELAESGYLDPAGHGAWSHVATSRYGRRDYGSAVMYEPGKVLIVGGSDPPEGAPTNTAEIIDLNDATPTWRYTGSMVHPRRHLNAVLLPDGTVLVTGGTSATGFSDLAGAVYHAERWDPTTGAWEELAANAKARGYHAATLLLPDGRVLHTGGGDGANLPRELNAEIFSPPYLFKGARPSIGRAPSAVEYGESFVVETPDGGSVDKVSWMRLPSVTHAFDANQRFTWLTFSRSSGGLQITAPATPALAPPGHYMLFLLNDEGVPSTARIVKLG